MPKSLTRPSDTPSPRVVERLLAEQYGQPNHFNKKDPLSELVFILLSTQTREAEYRRTFSALWRTYRSWERVRAAPENELVRLISFGGFARRKTALLKRLLTRIHSDKRRTSLRWLSAYSDKEAFAYLTSLPGVGPKTAKCVLMYSLGRSVFPVDTHVWRVSQRLGWIDGAKSPDDARSRQLESAIPRALRYSLHVTMVAHGRACCRTVPKCQGCVLRKICPQTACRPSQ